MKHVGYPGQIIGYRKNGAPIRLAAGGDGRGATTTLQERRTALLQTLERTDLTPDEHAAAVREADEVRSAIAAENERISQAAAARAALLGQEVVAPTVRTGGATTEVRGGDGAESPTRLTAGDLFVRSEEFQAFKTRGARGTVGVEMPTGLRAVIDNSATSGGAFQNPARPGDLPATNADRAPRLADLIDRRTTDSNTVEYVRDTTTAVGTAGGQVPAEVAENALKPESTYTFAVIVEPVRTIAHWVNLTRQTLDDNAQLRGYIEGRLAYGLENRLDQQIISGDGAAPNLRGILNVTGVGTYTGAVDEARVISIRKAMTVVQRAEYQPDTVVLHPIDWERIELSTDSQQMFRVSPNVANVLAPRIWGLNVVPTTAITGTNAGGTTGGRFIVGAFRTGATLWERMGVTTFITDSHASNFTSNVLTLLTEMRAALAVWRPAAFVAGTFGTGAALN